MNIDTDIVRERSTFSNLNSSRKLSILSKMSSITYHEWMEVINNLLSNDIRNPINSLQLSYTSKNVDAEKGKLVSEMTDNSFQKKTLHFISKTPAFNNISSLWDKNAANMSTNTCPSQEVINIQVPYDNVQATKQDS